MIATAFNFKKIQNNFTFRITKPLSFFFCAREEAFFKFRKKRNMSPAKNSAE